MIVLAVLEGLLLLLLIFLRQRIRIAIALLQEASRYGPERAMGQRAGGMVCRRRESCRRRAAGPSA